MIQHYAVRAVPDRAKGSDGVLCPHTHASMETAVGCFLSSAPGMTKRVVRLDGPQALELTKPERIEFVKEVARAVAARRSGA